MRAYVEDGAAWGLVRHIEVGVGLGTPETGGRMIRRIWCMKKEGKRLITGVCICDRSRSWQASKQSNPTASAVVIEEDALSVGL